MRDLQAVAARILRAGLWGGTALVAAAGALHVAAPGGGRWAGVVAATGIGVIVATPFATLLAMAIRGRHSVLGLYAAVTLGLALMGIVLAA